MVLRFRIYIFLAAFTIFFFIFSSIILVALVATCIFLASSSSAFFTKVLTFFLSLYAFYFFVTCNLAASFYLGYLCLFLCFLLFKS